jgi:hypothetical protein
MDVSTSQYRAKTLVWGIWASERLAGFSEYVPIANARIVQSFSVPTAVMAADHFGFIVEELIVKSTEIIG